jgi:hypothetical protein
MDEDTRLKYGLEAISSASKDMDLSIFGIVKMIEDPNNSLTLDSLINKYVLKKKDGGIVSLDQLMRPLGVM